MSRILSALTRRRLHPHLPIPMKRLPFFLATALLLAAATADDRLRDVQTMLKAQGFYYGDITGTDSPETTAAIRRYQIRNGITVTGKLNDDTLAALGFAVKKLSAPAIPPQPESAPAPEIPAQRQVNPQPDRPPAMPRPGEPITPLKKERAPLPQTEPEEAAQPPPRRALPNDTAVVEPPTPVPAPVFTPFSTMFRDTPYAAATREVQMGIVRRAQSFLAARRIYGGPIDGLAAESTSEAIFIFQERNDLRRTGRLDAATLAEMKLLPQPARGDVLLKPFYNPNRRRDRSVLPD